MFHTFQSSVPPTGGEGNEAAGKPARSSGSRRITTSNACVECRRRKIRCDGTQPCGQCQWYQHPEACAYSKPAQRVVPSRKLVEKLSGSVDRYKKVMETLFPTKDIDELASLSREELLNLALSPSAQTPRINQTSYTATSPSQATSNGIQETPRSDEADSLEALEEAPPECPEWDEAKRYQVKVQGISDDVNGLSMEVDRQSSYVGISSVTAALKVIVQAAPETRPFIAQSQNDTALPSRSGSPGPLDDHFHIADSDPNALPPPEEGQHLIESYFYHVHLFFPMIDEAKFWTMYLYADRKDAAWLALLNTVFALGSLAAGTSDNTIHTVYFKRARHHMTLETFGSGNFEMCQAMAILNGYYMHYLNRPNEANSLMGGTLRMATALGLHREYVENAFKGSTGNKHSDAVSAEMRRRTWWSLYCMDTWASTTLGRPSLGREGQGITVKLPSMLPDLAGPFEERNSPNSDEAMKILPLIHASEFCKIATVVQDRLAATPLLKHDELSQIDADLVRWRSDLPPVLGSDDPKDCPDYLRTPRAVMKWRWQNLRIILHRPILLSTALRGTPYVSLSAEEKVAVGKCRMFAARTIDDISAECDSTLIAGWNGVWLCFQACMVPLVSLFCCTEATNESPVSAVSDASNGSAPSITTGLTDNPTEWRRQVERALEFFRRMTRWSVAASKSATFIAKLLEAADQHAQWQMQQRQAATQAHAAAQASAMEQAQTLGFPDPVSTAMVAGLQAPVGLSQFGGWHDQSELGPPLSSILDDMAWDNFADFVDPGMGHIVPGMHDLVDQQFAWTQPTQEQNIVGWAPGH